MLNPPSPSGKRPATAAVPPKKKGKKGAPNFTPTQQKAASERQKLKKKLEKAVDADRKGLEKHDNRMRALNRNHEKQTKDAKLAFDRAIQNAEEELQRAKKQAQVEWDKKVQQASDALLKGKQETKLEYEKIVSVKAELEGKIAAIGKEANIETCECCEEDYSTLKVKKGDGCVCPSCVGFVWCVFCGRWDAKEKMRACQHPECGEVFCVEGSCQAYRYCTHCDNDDAVYYCYHCAEEELVVEVCGKLTCQKCHRRHEKYCKCSNWSVIV